MNSSHPSSRSTLRGVFAALACTASLNAQPPAGKIAGDGQDPAVQLSPFEVKAASGGYLSAETTSGTRYAAPVMEIPFAINTISSEFIENFLVFDFSGQDVLNYVSGSAPTNTGSTGDISLRGIRGFAVYKNGIREGGMWGPASIDRVEVLKGANAAIYGQSEPSGMTNRITKEGAPTPFQRLRATFGSGDFSRTMVDVNQPLVGQVLLSRFAASYEDSRQYVQDDAWFHRQNLYGSLTWKITRQTVFTTHAEYIKLKNNAQNTGNLPFVFTPFVNNGATSFQASGLLGRGAYEGFRSLNVNGPFNYNQVIYGQFDANVSHRFSDWLSLRVLGAHWERAQDNFGVQITNAGSGTLPAIGGLPAGGYLSTTYTDTRGNVYAPGLYATQRLNPSQNRELQSNAQADLLAAFKTGGIEHKLLVTADYINNHGRTFTRSSTRADATAPLGSFLNGGLHYNPTFPYAWDFYNPAVWDSLSANVRNETITKGFMVSERAALLQNRLFVIAGGRRDVIERGQRNYLGLISGPTATVPAGQWAQFPDQTKTTYQTGVVYKIRPALAAYVNYSSAFLPQGTGATVVDINGLPLDPQRGNSKELGFKASFLDDRLTFTTGAYDISRSNVPRTARDANGNALNIPGTAPGSTRNYSVVADVRSRGIEFDGNWRISDDFSAGFAASYNKITYIKVPNATEQFLLGVPPDNSPHVNLSSHSSYRIRGGLLKGLSLRGGVRYLGRSLVNNSTSSIYGDSGIKAAPVTVGGKSFDTYFFSQPAYVVAEGGLSYGWRGRNSRFGHSVSLDVKNLLNRKYLKGQRQGDPSSINFTYEIKH
jgi:outer membrane receptor protein involved in Fe transport